jgi:hypothetical protein
MNFSGTNPPQFTTFYFIIPSPFGIARGWLKKYSAFLGNAK